MNLFPEEDDSVDRAVSPVIGVILMVAITVILAAVIGTFVLNLSGSVSQQASAGVTVEDLDTNSSRESVSVTSLGDSTTGVRCIAPGDPTNGTTATQVGASIECQDGGAIVAYSSNSDIESKTIKTNIGN